MVSQERFLEVYMKNLIKAKKKFPDKYTWEMTEVFRIFKVMVQAFREGNYDRDGYAVKWTCNELRMKNDKRKIAKIFGTQKPVVRSYGQNETESHNDTATA